MQKRLALLGVFYCLITQPQRNIFDFYSNVSK